MRVLIFSHFFVPGVGGVESIVLSLASGLAQLANAHGEREFDVTVVTQTPTGNFVDQALPFCIVRQPSLLKLWRLIRAADVVHLAGPALGPLALAWLAKKPVVIEHHGYQAICPNGLLVHQPDGSICPGHFQARHYRECLRCLSCETPTMRGLLRLLLMFPRFWLCCKVAANIAITRHVLERQALPRSSVIYHGVKDLIANNHSWSQDGSGVSFAYLGRFVPEKGIPTLLSAANQLQQEGLVMEIRLIGDGPERRNIEQLIRHLGLENLVRLTGHLTGPALDDAVKDVSVVVMPSTWEETAGLAAIEQMMRGRLVIASDIGGLGEVVGDAALLFPAGDAAALADRMRAVLREPSLISSLGRKARGRALQWFQRQRMIDEHAAAYRQLHAERQS